MRLNAVVATGKLSHLLDKNAAWASRMHQRDPNFFDRLAHQQSPQYLWIGCSDSRVPANQIVDLPPGEIFVHRNVGNLVLPHDLNCLSVLQFAVDVLRIRHVIICGHYRCSGVRAALEHEQHRLVDDWLRPIHDLRERYKAELNSIGEPESRAARLCELNVIEQVKNVTRTGTVVDAWTRGHSLSIHGWIYDVADGLLRDLNVTVTGITNDEKLECSEMTK